jgi:hypothetical protein
MTSSDELIPRNTFFARHDYVFWVDAPCSLVEINFIHLMMETAMTSETSVNLYQTTKRNNPEDRNLHTHRPDDGGSNDL